jgi:transcriptional regulator GlxA family with amidase domain
MTLARSLRPVSGHQRKTARLSVGFLLLPNFTLCAFANFIDVLRLAADEGDRSRQINCRWEVLGENMDPVRSSCGILIHPTASFGDPDQFDYIVVVGGLMGGLSRRNERNEAYLKQAAKLGVPLVGLCTGSLALHRAGLMDGYKCCVSWYHHDDFLSQFQGLKPVSDQIFVVDRDRLTCSGGASSAHLAAFLVDRHLGRAPATKSLHIMMIHEAELGNTPQPASAIEIRSRDPLVRRALLLMQENLDVPLSIAELCRRLGTNKKRLERHFATEMGTPPLSAYLDLRLDHALHLLKGTERSVASIAAECGFCDSSHLSRMIRRRTGVTPLALRQQAETRQMQAA